MTRATGTSLKRRRKVIKAASGYWGRRKNTIRAARQAVQRALTNSYRDRRQRKRQMRALWIQRINAGARKDGLRYSSFIRGLKSSGIDLNRKMLSDMAIHYPDQFRDLVKKVAETRPK